jgi:hypothetical protein
MNRIKLPSVLGVDQFMKSIKEKFFKRKRHVEVPVSKGLAPEADQPFKNSIFIRPHLNEVLIFLSLFPNICLVHRPHPLNSIHPETAPFNRFRRWAANSNPQNI